MSFLKLHYAIYVSVLACCLTSCDLLSSDRGHEGVSIIGGGLEAWKDPKSTFLAGLHNPESTNFQLTSDGLHFRTFDDRGSIVATAVSMSLEAFHEETREMETLDNLSFCRDNRGSCETLGMAAVACRETGDCFLNVRIRAILLNFEQPENDSLHTVDWHEEVNFGPIESVPDVFYDFIGRRVVNGLTPRRVSINSESFQDAVDRVEGAVNEIKYTTSFMDNIRTLPQ